jgi:hypothetical protein
MRALHTFILSLGIAASAHAQLVVTNPVSDALAQVNHIEDVAKSLEIINNQVQQLNTLTQQLQQTTAYVQALGDPAKLLNIVGVNGLIHSLETTGVGHSLGELQQLASGIDALRNNANGLYQSIGETIQTPSGFELPRAEELYRKFAASEQATQNFQSVFNDVIQRRQALKVQIAQATLELQAATTDAETQKLSGVLTGFNAELAAIDKEIDQALATTLVQDIQNRTDREKQQQARKEERQAEFGEALGNYSKTFGLDAAPAAFPTR